MAWRTLKTARLSQGAQGSGRAPSSWNSIGSRPLATALLDERVDARRIRVEHRPRLGVEGLVVRPGARDESEASQQDVVRHAGRPHVLRPAAGGAAAVVLHVPEPVLRVNVTLGDERVPDGRRTDVRDPLGVAPHLHARSEPRDGTGPRHVGQRGSQAGIALARGHVPIVRLAPSTTPAEATSLTARAGTQRPTRSRAGPSKAGVERVAQRIAEEVQPEHGQGDRQSGVDGRPRAPAP